MVSRLGEGHMPCTFFLSEPQLKTTVYHPSSWISYNSLCHYPILIQGSIESKPKTTKNLIHISEKNFVGSWRNWGQHNFLIFWYLEGIEIIVKMEILTSTRHPWRPGTNLNSKLSTYRWIGVVWVPLVESPLLPRNYKKQI